MKRLSRSVPGFLDRFLNRPASRGRRSQRRLAMEPLESRHLLSVTLGPITDQTVLAGAPLNLALAGSSSAGNPIEYTLEISNTALSGNIPAGNPSLRIDVAGGAVHGTMVLQLFEDLAPETVQQIVSLANANFYDGLIFHRVIDGFMIQGGDPDGDGTGGPGFKFDDEFHPDLQFTGPGLLAMANSGRDTNGSQFFITAGPTRWLDFRHTIFGLLTEGEDVRQQINDVTTGANGKPVADVVMTQVTVFHDDQNGVLRLSAPRGTTGTAQVTVTATDSVTGEWASQTFEVIIGADTSVPPPFLAPIDPIVTTVNTPVTFQIPVVDVYGSSLYYSGNVQPHHPNLALVVSHSTGEVTLTPSGGAVGVFGVFLGVDTWSFQGFDTQMVPVYIHPAAPSSVALLPQFDTGASDSDGVTNLNNSPGATLQFQVHGVRPGMEVELLANGAVIGKAVATGTSVVVTTDGTTVLSDGTYEITARQTLKGQSVDVGNLQTTVDLPSAASTPMTMVVDTAPPQFTTAPVKYAHEQATYSYRAMVKKSLTGVVFDLLAAPPGMVIDSATGQIAWMPVPERGTVVQVIVQATDLAGNSASQAYSIEVLPPNNAPVLVPANPVLGATDNQTPLTLALAATFINGGPGTTVVTDVDLGAVVGGIALAGTTGAGTWQYSLDGAVFLPVGEVAEHSALLLPAYASLRYVPDADAGETATITYRAWDTTAGLPGDRFDTTASGGTTGFSTALDTASLTVTAAPQASISGFVYIDANDNGQRITPEGQPHLAISGVTIRLYRVASGEPVLVASTVTGPDGSYHFSDLPAGTYLVEQVQPPNFLDGRDTPGTVGGQVRGTVDGPDRFRVELGSNEHGTEYNFGERGLKPGAISLRLLLASASFGSSGPPDNSTPAPPSDPTPPAAPAVAGLLAITEMNYNPYPPTAFELAAGFTDAQAFEFIELRNVGTTPIDLTGVAFTAGIEFDFTAGAIRTLAPGEYVLVVRSPEAFRFRYGNQLPVAGQYDGELNNSGERITLRDRAGAVIHDFIYRQYGYWPDAAHGGGSSLEVRDLAENYNDPAAWVASAEHGGTPGGQGINVLDFVFSQDDDWQHG